MTLFAGVMRLQPGESLAEGCADAVRGQLSRHPEDHPRMFVGDGFAFAHVNLGLLEGDSAYTDADGAVSLLAGEPFSSSAAASRADDLHDLHHAWRRADGRTLAAARGSFSLAHADTRARRVRLVADKLALRPLHYAVIDGTLFFATSIRVLLALAPPLAARPDLTAQAQLATLGHALGDRTPYAAIRSVEPGHLVEVDASGAHASAYWHWDDIGPADVHEDEFGARLHAAFCEATRLRQRGSASAVAQLSGGLDSRCVVAALRQTGAEVHTLNYAPAGSADMVLGRLSAHRLGSRHFELVDGQEDFWDRMVIVHSRWMQHVGAGSLPCWPRRIWGGFAGDTLLGPTGISTALVRAMNDGRIDAAIDAHTRGAGGQLSGRLFVRERREAMLRCLRASLHAELAKRSNREPGRRYQTHILLNETRGDLALHHENLDLRRIELVAPFCDAEVVALALSYPLERMLGHRFYYRWLERFPAAVAATPWQAYPGSEPCPLPLPAGLRSQWGDGWFGRKDARLRTRRQLRQAACDLADAGFPDSLLDKRMLSVAYWLVRCGMTRYMYLLNAARVFVQHAPRAAPRANPATTATTGRFHC